MIKAYKEGDLVLTAGADKKQRYRPGKFPEVEKRLIEFIDCRLQNYQEDKCGLSWHYMHHKADEIAKSCLQEDQLKIFRNSSGWLNNCLKRNNIIGVSLHGEKNCSRHQPQITPRLRR
jgi:hypothetical protein